MGPVWRGGRQGEPERLASCWRNSLRLAREHDLRRLAFPAISCGVYGYPLHEATALAVRTLRGEGGSEPFEVILCSISKPVDEAWHAALAIDKGV